MSLSRSLSSRIAAAIGKSLRRHHRKAGSFRGMPRASILPIMEPLALQRYSRLGE